MRQVKWRIKKRWSRCNQRWVLAKDFLFLWQLFVSVNPIIALVIQDYYFDLPNRQKYFIPLGSPKYYLPREPLRLFTLQFDLIALNRFHLNLHNQDYNYQFASSHDYFFQLAIFNFKLPTTFYLREYFSDPN